MPASEVPCGRNSAGRTVVVHESPRTRVTRLHIDGRTAICKEPLGPDGPRRLEHELAVLERLRGVAGVAQLVDSPRRPGAIVEEDVGGTSLAAVAMPVPGDVLIGLAVRLGRAVAGMHRRGVSHRDISTANVVLSRDGAPCLVDFALATLLAEIRPESGRHTEFVGTPAYLAPEQTGRTGRPVDERADLYALGATLYELATGAPPFGSGDPLRLAHDHLTRIPVPPVRVNPDLSAALSEIVMHLLEKEPDNRYQTAQGLVHDLEWLRDNGPAALSVGEHDVPLRLAAPTRLVGCDAQAAALEAAFADALAGRCRGVLVGGVSGVGKTSLVDGLRPVVTDRDGWFVAGKFDQFRPDLEFDAVSQALRALGRLLLAEPEDDVVRVRRQILEAVGANAGVLSAVLPEFAALLAVPPAPGDPLTAQVRAQRVAVQVLRAVASRNRPVVVFVDDLQWAGSTPRGVVDILLCEEPIDGLLLVGAYREDALDPAHPLAEPLSRWREQAGVRHLRLANLPEADTVTMVAEMLHVNRAGVVGLVGAMQARTSGNPYETVELLNALRRDGVLSATAGGWRWDEAAVREHLGRAHDAVPAGPPAARADTMPPATRRMVEVMACLGGRAELDVLRIATGEPAGEMRRRLAPALDAGLLVLERGAQPAHPAVCFRHDRLREAILYGLNPGRLRSLRLAAARRLAAVPGLSAVAAEQYLPVIDAVDRAAERSAVVELLRGAAGQAALIGNHTLVNALLEAALRLAGPHESDVATLVDLRSRRQGALYGIGRLDEAEQEYRAVAALCPAVIDRVDATVVQLRVLTHRNRFADVIDLGRESLRELGVDMPPADRLAVRFEHGFDEMYRWLEHPDDAGEPAITDERLLAASRLINAILPAAYLATDHTVVGWLSLEALRIWMEYGPAPELLGPASHTAWAVVVARGDYAAGWRALRRFLALGEARGYEPATSQVRMLSALFGFWSEPLENSITAARTARRGLIAAGDLANAGYSYVPSVVGLFDCAPSLDAHRAEVTDALAFVLRTGDVQCRAIFECHRWLAGALRGEHGPAAGRGSPVDTSTGNSLDRLNAHIAHAVAAAVLDDPAALMNHTAAAMPLLATIPGAYLTALVRVLHGLALAAQARVCHGDDCGEALSELDEVMRWLAERAAAAPMNFQHLLRLLEAERAWAAGDFRAAVLGFDAARSEAFDRGRPWHQALIIEHQARFYLAQGVEHTGFGLLAEARHEYRKWGATAKVDQLDWAYPALRPHADRPGEPFGRRSAAMGKVDLLGILSASQALSSETDVAGLYSRLVGVLSEMTGATGVSLLLWSEDRRAWLQPGRGRGDGAIPAAGTRFLPAVPMSVLRYARRVGEPLVVADATRDDRFARDPYFADAGCCSLLAVPIVSRGTLKAVLVLENRLIRGAFTAHRLDVVKLIAGQLTVALANAHLYERFRRVADEQAALRRVATLVARGDRPELVFAAVADEVGTLFAADAAAIVRFEPDGDATTMGSFGAERARPGSRGSTRPGSATASVQSTKRAARRDAGPESAVASPILVEGRVWGAISVASLDQPLPRDAEQRLDDFTELVATAIANTASRAELTASRARIVTAADQSRRRIERNLHDGAQQQLVALVLDLRSAQQALPPGLGEIDAQLEHAVAEATGTLDELREISRGVHPVALAEGGLGPALQTLARRSPIPVELNVRLAGRLPEAVEISAYYIVAEALTNVAKHAQATAVTVGVDVERSGAADAVLHLEVRDDGIGGTDFARGSGLVGLKDRAEALGGRVVLHSPRGAGTTLLAQLPVTAPIGPAG